ncbi:hypothetical protein RYX36_002591, partial [Vicia faba]
MGTLNLLGLLGGFLADANLGRYVTIVIFSPIAAMRLCLLTLATRITSMIPPLCRKIQETTRKSFSVIWRVLFLAWKKRTLSLPPDPSLLHGYVKAQLCYPFPIYIILLIITLRLISTVGKTEQWKSSVPTELTTTNNNISEKLITNPKVLEEASNDYGNLEHDLPAAVFRPTTVNDIATLIKLSFNSSVPFRIAARGQGHSTRGQAMARDGVVVDMKGLRERGDREVVKNNIRMKKANDGIKVFGDSKVGYYVDVGKGEFVTWSKQKNSELFHGVLGGLGQFGIIIIKARIPLQAAPKRVKWIRLLYSDFEVFTKDQESLTLSKNSKLDYLEGIVLMHQGPINNWRSSFFPLTDHQRILFLVTQHRVLYCLEIAKYYDHHYENTLNKEIQILIQGLNYIRGFYYEKNVSFVEFLNRMRSGELKVQSQGLWDVPHPWLNMFIPKSRIMDFNSGVFNNIIQKRNITIGPILDYPMNRN